MKKKSSVRTRSVGDIQREGMSQAPPILRGYDMDGVLTAGVKPVGNFVVISGRTFAEYDKIAQKVATVVPVYIRGVGAYGDRIHSGNFKAAMILMLGVQEFHEDDPVQIEIIRRHCPQCAVIQE